MYANRKLAKDHEFKVRVDAITCDRVLKLANGQQPAAYLCHLTGAVVNAVLDQQLSGVVFLGDSKASKVSE